MGTRYDGNAPINGVVTGGQIKMVGSGFIKYSSFVVENERTMQKRDFVISRGKETITTLGSNCREAAKQCNAAIQTFDKSKMETGL